MAATNDTKYISLTGLGQFLNKLKTGAASKTVMGKSIWGSGDIDISYNSSHFTYNDKKIALKVQHTTGYKFDSNKPTLDRISVGTLDDLINATSGISVPDPVNFSKGQEIFWPEMASTEVSSTNSNGRPIYKAKSQYNLNYMTKPGVFTIHARHMSRGSDDGVDNQMNLPPSITLGSVVGLQTRLTVTAVQCDDSFIRYDDDYSSIEDCEFVGIDGHEVVTQKAEISGANIERGTQNKVNFSGTWVRTGYRTVTDAQKASNTNVPFTWTEWANQDPSTYDMSMVKSVKTTTGKYWLLGHNKENSTTSTYTHNKCYMNGGKLYSNGYETVNTRTFNPVKTDVESVKEKVSYVDLTTLETTWLSGDNYNYVGIGTAIEGDFGIGLWADTDNPGKKLTANFYLNFGGSGTVKFDASKGTYIAVKNHTVNNKGVLALKVERIPWGQSNNKIQYLINCIMGTMVDSTKQSLVPLNTTAYTPASEVSEVSEE